MGCIFSWGVVILFGGGGGGSSYGGTYIIVGKGILSFGVVFFFGGCPYLWGGLLLLRGWAISRRIGFFWLHIFSWGVVILI